MESLPTSTFTNINEPAHIISQNDEFARSKSIQGLKLKLLTKHLRRSRVISIGLVFVVTCLLCAGLIEIYLRLFLPETCRSRFSLPSKQNSIRSGLDTEIISGGDDYEDDEETETKEYRFENNEHSNRLPVSPFIKRYRSFATKYNSKPVCNNELKPNQSIPFSSLFFFIPPNVPSPESIVDIVRYAIAFTFVEPINIEPLKPFVLGLLTQAGTILRPYADSQLLNEFLNSFSDKDKLSKPNHFRRFQEYWNSVCINLSSKSNFMFSISNKNVFIGPSIDVAQLEQSRTANSNSNSNADNYKCPYIVISSNLTPELIPVFIKSVEKLINEIHEAVKFTPANLPKYDAIDPGLNNLEEYVKIYNHIITNLNIADSMVASKIFYRNNSP